MCLGTLPAKYKADLNRVLYPTTDWQVLYHANEVLEYENMQLFLMDRDWRELGQQWQQAAEYLWQAGRSGVPMSVDLATEALDIWTGCRSYRNMNGNIGVDYTQIVPSMRELLGAERWGTFEQGWFAFNYQPTLEFMAEFHIKFEHIHPLFDGNGRWGRLLLVYCYGRMGLRPGAIENRAAYIAAVENKDGAALAALL